MTPRPTPAERDRRRKIAKLKEHAFKHPSRGDKPLNCPFHRYFTEALTEPGRPIQILCSFDVGYHSSGWFKNSDYEQCLHVSLSHPGEGTEVRQIPLSFGGGTHEVPKLETPSNEEASAWATEFFGPTDALKVWVEPAASPLDIYRMPNIVHLRLYYDADLRPFMPQGEVYHLRPLIGLSPPKILQG